MPAGPERSCVGCRRRAPKALLLRIVRTSQNSLLVDPSGSAPGRGAYVHPDPGCVEAAFAREGLARALRAGARRDGADRLRDVIEQELRSG
ncbi:MAG: YlxR family protein [Actinomycetota bacterium]